MEKLVPLAESVGSEADFLGEGSVGDVVLGLIG